MKQAINHARRLPLNFDGECSMCRRPTIPGRSRCSYCSGRATRGGRRGYWRESAVVILLIPPRRPLPAWLFDPSLLPRRPPGVV